MLCVFTTYLSSIYLPTSKDYHYPTNLSLHCAYTYVGATKYILNWFHFLCLPSYYRTLSLLFICSRRWPTLALPVSQVHPNSFSFWPLNRLNIWRIPRQYFFLNLRVQHRGTLFLSLWTTGEAFFRLWQPGWSHWTKLSMHFVLFQLNHSIGWIVAGC